MRTGLVRKGQDEYLSRAEIQKIQAKYNLSRPVGWESKDRPLTLLKERKERKIQGKGRFFIFFLFNHLYSLLWDKYTRMQLFGYGV